MSKTKKSSSAGGGGGQHAARITKAPRRENAITQFAAASHLFNGVTETTTSTGAVSGSFANIGQRERTTLGVGLGTMSNSSRPSPTCNSSTVEDRRPHSWTSTWDKVWIFSEHVSLLSIIAHALIIS